MIKKLEKIDIKTMIIGIIIAWQENLPTMLNQSNHNLPKTKTRITTF